MAVYGRRTGLPLASTRASAVDALTRRQEATGMRDAALSGSSKTKLSHRK